MFMQALEVVLDFRCCICGHDMGVTLKCEGKGLASGLDTVASVKVPCPTCGDHQLDLLSLRGNVAPRGLPNRRNDLMFPRTFAELTGGTTTMAREPPARIRSNPIRAITASWLPSSSTA